jgi:hypothetical protein
MMRHVNMRLAGAAVFVGLSAWYLARVFGLGAGRLPEDGLGDWMDPYFINYLLEHWYRSLLTFSDPASPPMYFPERGTLGYSHGLILYAPFYAAVRPFLDPFQAYTAALLLMMLAGATCLYLFLRKAFALGFAEAGLLTACVLTSPNVINQGTGVWSQRASVFLIPPILLLGLSATRARGARLRLVLAFLSGCAAMLLLTQDFYTAAFTALLVALFGVVFLVPLAHRARTAWRRAPIEVVVRDDGPDTRARPQPSLWWLAAASVFFILAVVIFVHPIDWTVEGGKRISARDPERPLMVALLTGGWFAIRRWRLVDRARVALRQARGPVREILVEAGLIGDHAGRRVPVVAAWAAGALAGILVFVWIYLDAYLLHRGFPLDHLLGSLVKRGLPRGNDSIEWIANLPSYTSMRPFWLMLGAAALVWIPAFKVSRAVRFFALWCLVVAVVVILISLNISGFSLWRAVFAGLPGLTVVRDPTRIIYVYDLAAVILTGALVARTRHLAARVALIAISSLLLVTQWNDATFNFDRPREVFRQWVEAPVSIDPACRSFFIKGASQTYMARSDHMWTLYSIDAAFIALKYELPTLNGYSAWGPEGWDLANPQEREYPERVRKWIARRGLTSVCALDIDARTMTPYR